MATATRRKERQPELTEAAKPPTIKKAINEILSPAAMQLINAAPQNPTTRALVMKYAGKAIPDELTTYNTIRNWLEDIDWPAPVEPEQIEIQVSASQIESGRCDYQATVRGSGILYLKSDTILGWLDRCLTIADLENRIGEWIEQEARESIPMTDYREISTEQYDTDEDGPENFEVDYKFTQIKTSIMETISRLAPAAHKRLTETI